MLFNPKASSSCEKERERENNKQVELNNNLSIYTYIHIKKKANLLLIFHVSICTFVLFVCMYITNKEKKAKKKIQLIKCP